VTCAIGSLTTRDASDSATITIVVRPTRAGSLSNTAAVSGAQPDPAQDNNTAVQTTRVTADSVAPRTEATLSPEPNASGWHRTNVTVTLRATDGDGGSGVKALTYSATGAQTTGTTTVSGAVASLVITAEGETTLRFRAEDAAGNREEARRLTVRIDRTAPTFGACTANPSSLWPPNHKLVDVSVSVIVKDRGSGPGGFVLRSVTSNEPDDGLGDGDSPNDIQKFQVGTPDTSGKLRAERSGGGAGRTYTLVYEGTDAAGNTAVCSATVTVPRNQQGDREEAQGDWEGYSTDGEVEVDAEDRELSRRI
jgi:hypothetical protein